MEGIELFILATKVVASTIVVLFGGGAMGVVKIRKIGKERKIDQEVATQQATLVNEQAGLITVFQDTVDDFRAELQIVRTDLQTAQNEKNALAEDLQNALTKYDKKVQALVASDSNLIAALANVDEQKRINGQQAIKLSTATGALDTLRQEFAVQQSVLNELLPVAGKVDVLNSKIEVLEKALEDADHQRLAAERELRELKDIGIRKDEKILKLGHRVDTVERSNADLRRLVDALQKPPPPEPPLKLKKAS